MNYNRLQFASETLLDLRARIRSLLGDQVRRCLIHGAGMTGLAARAALSLDPAMEKIVWSDGFPDRCQAHRMGLPVLGLDEIDPDSIDAALIASAPSVALQILPSLRRCLPPRVPIVSLMNVEEMTDGLEVDTSGADGSTEAPFILPLAVSSVLRYLLAREHAHGRVLDIACGTGYGSYLLGGQAAKEGLYPKLSREATTASRNFAEGATRVEGMDRDPVVISAATRYFPLPNVQFSVGDLYAVRESFDSVVSFETLEHIDDFEKGLLHLAGLARSVFVFSVPYKEPPNGYHFHRTFDLDEERINRILPGCTFYYQSFQGEIDRENHGSAYTLIGIHRGGSR